MNSASLRLGSARTNIKKALLLTYGACLKHRYIRNDHELTVDNDVMIKATYTIVNRGQSPPISHLMSLCKGSEKINNIRVLYFILSLYLLHVPPSLSLPPSLSRYVYIYIYSHLGLVTEITESSIRINI